ncbi:MAG: hypothetical protein ACT4PE_08485 [Candidatus Eiseniibacteriota bacterium]
MEFRADRWSWSASRRAGALPLTRRGTAFGWVRRTGRSQLDAEAGRARWDAAEAVHLGRALAPRFASLRPAVTRTARAFRRFRDGGLLEPEVWRRCSVRGPFVPAGVSADLGDVREIEKVHADLRRGGRIVARDVWAKLSWITARPGDASLRVRFSFGAERLDDWRSDLRRARAADDFAEAVFPECRLLDRNTALHRTLETWTGGKVRLSERIVFWNAPGGGAAFHDDAEEGQLGVAYAQLTGRTGWLAVSKRRLAVEVAELTGRAGERAGLRLLDAHDSLRVDRLLNGTPHLARRLVGRGAFVALSPADVLLLPSHGPDDAAWHSVFSLGERPGLALSFGIFRA